MESDLAVRTRSKSLFQSLIHVLDASENARISNDQALAKDLSFQPIAARAQSARAVRVIGLLYVAFRAVI
jgi:hypothetical protein